MPGEDEFALALGDRLRAVREARGVTQREVSQWLAAAGYPISESLVSQIERGRTDPSVRTFCWLCRASGVTPSALLSPTSRPWQRIAHERRKAEAEAVAARLPYPEPEPALPGEALGLPP